MAETSWKENMTNFNVFIASNHHQRKTIHNSLSSSYLAASLYANAIREIPVSDSTAFSGPIWDDFETNQGNEWFENNNHINENDFEMNLT